MTPANRLRAILSGLLALLWAMSPAFAAELDPGRKGYEYLFLVDSSLSMGSKKKAVVRTIQDLIATEFHRRSQPGDRIGIWLCNQEFFNTGFSAVNLGSDAPKTNAAAAGRFLTDYHFDNKPSLTKSMPALGRVVNGATNLTLILIHNGAKLDWGSPFDDPVNAVYAAKAFAMRRANRPFVTTFIVQNGRMTNWRVHTTEDVLELPEVPPRPTTPMAASQSGPTAPTIVTNAPIAPPEAALPEPVKVTYLPPIPTPAPPPAAPTGNAPSPFPAKVSAAIPSTTPPSEPERATPPPRIEEPPKERPEPPKLENPAPQPKPVEASPQAVAPKEKEPETGSDPKTPLLADSTPAHDAKDSSLVTRLLSVVGTLALAGMAVAFFLKGRRKRGPSLISSSLTIHGDGK